MNRLIIHKRFQCYESVCAQYEPYDYPPNAEDYACIDIDSEYLSLIILTLAPTHKIERRHDLGKRIFNNDMPVYVVMIEDFEEY